MIQDINIPEIKNVTVVIQPDSDGEIWSVHLINSNNYSLKNILVASKGYSQKTPGHEETSTIRQRFETLQGKTSTQIN